MPECLKPTNCKAKSLVAKCGNISDKFAYLMQTKEMLRTVLIEKGQDVPKDLPFRDYVEKLAALPSSTDVVSSILDYQGVQHKGEVLVDKAFIGLENVDNTSDLNKPLSIATEEALSAKQDIESQDLLTASKTIVGAINELKTAIETQNNAFIITESRTNLPPSAVITLPIDGSNAKINFETDTIKDINIILIVTDENSIMNKFNFSFTMGKLNNKALISERYLETLVSFGSPVNIKLVTIPENGEQSNFLTIELANMDEIEYEVLCSMVCQKKLV